MSGDSMDMWPWILVSVLAVVGVKYYTAIGACKLNQRLNAVQNGLRKTRNELEGAKKTQLQTQLEETELEERIRRMREIIDDLGGRLAQTDVAEDSAE